MSSNPITPVPGTKQPSPWRQLNAEFPEIAAAYRRVLNTHFLMAADEHNDAASDARVRKHDEAFCAADAAFGTMLLLALRVDRAEGGHE